MLSVSSSAILVDALRSLRRSEAASSAASGTGGEAAAEMEGKGSVPSDSPYWTADGRPTDDFEASEADGSADAGADSDASSKSDGTDGDGADSSSVGTSALGEPGGEAALDEAAGGEARSPPPPSEAALLAQPDTIGLVHSRGDEVFPLSLANILALAPRIRICPHARRPPHLPGRHRVPWRRPWS